MCYHNATALLARVAAISTPPVNVLALAGGAGVEVVYEPINRELHGFLFWGPKWPVIVVNSCKEFAEQRETIAHELYHVCEGARQNIVHRLSRTYTLGQNPSENAADAFASLLLMPLGLIVAVRSRCVGVEDMAGLFGVTKQTMALRLLSLDLLSLAVPAAGAISA